MIVNEAARYTIPALLSQSVSNLRQTAEPEQLEDLTPEYMQDLSRRLYLTIPDNFTYYIEHDEWNVGSSLYLRFNLFNETENEIYHMDLIRNNRDDPWYVSIHIVTDGDMESLEHSEYPLVELHHSNLEI